MVVLPVSLSCLIILMKLEMSVPREEMESETEKKRNEIENIFESFKLDGCFHSRVTSFSMCFRDMENATVIDSFGRPRQSLSLERICVRVTVDK